ncbi:MAG: signal recognition particle protein [Spirochaetales bacterium]|nr:signal recognition particle protein [Spirochaetales bacterium]
MLNRISDTFTDIVRSVSGQNRITEKNVDDAVEQIKLALLEADVNLRVVRRFVNKVLKEAKGEAVLRAVSPGQQFVKVIYDRMVALLGDTRQDLALKGPDTLSVILLYGLQGSGKTTTAAKLAVHLKSKGRRPMLAAADLVRPAAITQLQVLAEENEIPILADLKAKDPVRVVKDALAKAKKDQYDVLIIDTAGRMQADSGLMKELASIKKAADPVEALLVADAMTGQTAVDIAQSFHEQIGLTGIILTKFDSDTRGGAALSIKTITDQPIKFIGVGEKIRDLEPFYPERIASRILGMGDVVSLVEKAQESFDETEALELQKKMASSSFTLEDYLQQFQKMKKMGNMESLLGMIPGLKAEDAEKAVNSPEIKIEEAIILSMTVKERRNHLIVGSSRRRRIAHGSGTSVYEVNKLIKKFEKMRLMMKKLSKNKGYQAQFMKQLGGE